MAPTETVAFNVGGTHFDVSKSLLAQYPDCILSRMIAKEWDDGSKKPLFIERDANVFAKVLSYMRDYSITLPASVTKDAFEKDLVYYGISANPNSISWDFDEPKLQLKALIALRSSSIPQLAQRHRKVNAYAQHLAVALHLVERFSATNALSCLVSTESLSSDDRINTSTVTKMFRVLSFYSIVNEVNSILADYGLHLIRNDESVVKVKELHLEPLGSL